MTEKTEKGEDDGNGAFGNEEQMAAPCAVGKQRAFDGLDARISRDRLPGVADADSRVSVPFSVCFG